MKTINVILDNQAYSLVAPAFAAAYCVSRTSETEALLIFRLKRQDQLTDRDTINEAEELFPNLKWEAVSSNPGIPAAAGVGPMDPQNGMIKLEKKGGRWMLLSTSNLQPYLATQNDLGGDQAALPGEAILEDEDLAQLIGSTANVLAELSAKSKRISNE